MTPLNQIIQKSFTDYEFLVWKSRGLASGMSQSSTRRIESRLGRWLTTRDSTRRFKH